MNVRVMLRCGGVGFIEKKTSRIGLIVHDLENGLIREKNMCKCKYNGDQRVRARARVTRIVCSFRYARESYKRPLSHFQLTDPFISFLSFSQDRRGSGAAGEACL